MTLAVSAGNACWRFYKEGVLTLDDNCPTRPDHAVVAVGLETETVSEKTCRRAKRKERKAKECNGTGDVRFEINKKL